MFRLALVLVLVLPLQGAWLTDLKEAKRQAFEEKKDVYVVFLATEISSMKAWVHTQRYTSKFCEEEKAYF